MKSVLVLAVLCGLVFTVTQGSPLKAARKTQSLSKCNEKQIDKMIDKIVDDTYALKEDAYKAYENAYSGMLNCVLSSFTELVSCVEGVVVDNVEELEAEFQTYLTTVQKLAQKIVVEIKACA